MAERGTRSYPPVGDPDRLDSILHRGRALRRRRQLVATGAGAGGAMAVMLVAVLLMGSGGGDRADGQVVADDGTSTTTTTTTTTTTAPPSAGLSVELLDGPARIRVDDPAQPDGIGTQQCVLVRVLDPSGGGSAIAEGFECAPGSGGNGMDDVAMRLTMIPESGTGPEAEVGPGPDLGGGTPVEIGCAAVTERPAPEAVNGTAARPGVTTFTLSAPELAAGSYEVEVQATSGIGDGCPPQQDGEERENTATRTGTLTFP